MGKKSGMNVCVEEEVRIAVRHSIDRFLEKDEQELEFPSSLTSTERAYIHRLSSQIGLVSKSKGKGSDRYITLRKKKKGDASNSAAVFTFGQNSTRVLHSLLHRWPVKLKEKMDLQPRSSKQPPGASQDPLGTRPDGSKTSGRLNNGIPQVPVKRGKSDLDEFRKTLPVAGMADQLLTAIDKYPVVLICGETGSGKTTQIPQFILDECYNQGERRCRILCTQPRRISAVAMAERVAAERGECVGHTVGYQIRLESRVSPRTLLTFCTNGVLLRTLMAGDSALSTVTHVIVDEVHERDRFCDFLLIKLKQLIQSRGSPRRPKFKLILMSAALDVDLFRNYFNDCPVINIPGKMYEVKEYYLEDVLKMTGRFGSGASSLQEWRQADEAKKKSLEKLTTKATNVENNLSDEVDGLGLNGHESLGSWRTTAMDEALHALWYRASALLGENDDDDKPNPFPQIFHLIQSEDVPVDYRHSESGVTALMASAMQGAMEECERLLALGADPSLKASNGWTAADMANQLGHEDLAEALCTVIAEKESFEIPASSSSPNNMNSVEESESSFEMSEEDRKIVSTYQKTFDDDQVDTDIIMELLCFLCKENDNDAVLIFLPGYDDIVTLREMILSDEYRHDLGNIKLYVLHSSMQSSSDQKLVFRPPPSGYRKIILSTNIAETAVTIEDVVYVIDSGKVKIKIYEALTSTSTLKSVWTSKSSALQRKGRAGRCRPGICFHLFSRSRFAAMSQYQTAELLRTPLHELCLQAKLLATAPKKRRSKGEGNAEFCDPRSESQDTIAEFLSRAPEAPSRIMLDNAVNLLKTIDALDQWEDLTELGHHLVDLPIEPRLGKMVLYSVVLKCLDPVLTIACALAYKDPFLLPQAPAEKRQAINCRVKLAAGAFSDHMCLLRAFQAWQKARIDGWEKAFCNKNYLSPATMQMIIGMRTQLLGQLRAAGFVRARGGSDIRDLNTNSENWAVVKAALCASAYPNILRFQKEGMKLCSRQHKKVRFHTSSVLSRAQGGKKMHIEALKSLPTNWVVYDELTMAAGHFSGLATARCCTVVSPACISLFSGPAHLTQGEAVIEPDSASQMELDPLDSDSESEDKEKSKYSTLLISDWIRLKMEPQLCEMVLDLRTKWYSLFLRRIHAPAKLWLPEDEAVLSTIINILSSEDQANNLLQPSGIGQRPKPMSQEDNQRGSGFTGPRIRTPNKRKTPEPIRPSSSNRVRTPQSVNPTRPPSGRLSSSLGLEERSSESSPCLSPPLIVEDVDLCKIVPEVRICYLAVFCQSSKNLHISQRNGVWLTCRDEEKLLSSAFQNSAKVLLMVFLQDMRVCQGYARLTSPGTQFANAGESENFGWEKDPKHSNEDLTAYFSLEWISKTPNQMETLLIENEMSAIWEIDSCEGERLLSLFGTNSSCQPTSMLSPQASSQGPQSPNYPNPYLSYGFPTVPQTSVYNPYQGSSPLQPFCPQGYSSMGQFYNPYQFQQQQPSFTPPNVKLPTSSTQTTTNYFSQSK